MTTRTIKTLSGDDLTLPSDALTPLAIALAEVLSELSAEQGHPESLSISYEELADRLIKNGYDPVTGTPLN